MERGRIGEVDAVGVAFGRPSRVVSFLGAMYGFSFGVSVEEKQTMMSTGSLLKVVGLKLGGIVRLRVCTSSYARLRERLREFMTWGKAWG